MSKQIKLSEIIKEGFKLTNKNFGIYLWMNMIIFAGVFIQGITNLFIPVLGSILVSSLIVYPLTYSMQYRYLESLRGTKPEIEDIFKIYDNNFLNLAINLLGFNLIIFIGYVLLIIPGIILTIKLTFVPLLLIDKKLNLTQAMKKSWIMTRGNILKIIGLIFVSLLMLTLGLVLLIIGLIPASLYLNGIWVKFYNEVLEK